MSSYNISLLVKWNAAVTFLIPLTFYSLGNLAQQQEFNHIHGCKRQNKVPLNSEGDVTSKVSEASEIPWLSLGRAEAVLLVFLTMHHYIPADTSTHRLHLNL